MAQERLSMRKIKEILRLKLTSGLSNRQIAKSFGVSRGYVDNYWRRAQPCGFSTWEAVMEFSDEELEGKLLAEETEERPRIPPTIAGHKSKRPMPDFQKVHEELRSNKHVTLTLLWEEYKQEHPLGLQKIHNTKHPIPASPRKTLRCTRRWNPFKVINPTS